MVRDIVLKPWENVVLYLSQLLFFHFFFISLHGRGCRCGWPVTIGREVKALKFSYVFKQSIPD